MLWPLSAFGADVSIEGRVFTQTGPLPAATVTAHRSYADLKAGVPPVAAATTDRDGVYRLRLPDGAYYFTARGKRDGQEFFAYHGNNPISLPEGKLWVALMATGDGQPPLYGDGPDGVEGRVTYKGEPVTGAYVALYPQNSRTFKGLGIKTESVGTDGRFKLAVPPGEYVVTARRISSGKSNRPPQKGDLYCYYPRNPVEIKDGQTARIELSCYPKIDRNDFVGTPPLKADDIKTVADTAARSNAGIRGRVTDRTGRPLRGMMVLAYRLTSPVFMMYHVYHGSEYSAETDAEGMFFIPLDESGDYGVVARDILGDGPHRGEFYGLYQGNSRHAVSFTKGSLVSNIAITAGEVMAPATGADQGRKQAVPAEVVGTPGGASVVLTDSVITADTVWQGDIRIRGVIAVKRGATLTIRPGTRVQFHRIDRDRNEIGDGEILVEGRLIARGAGGNEIVFSSAEKTPKVNDWSYLQFLASDEGNVIEHCRFEHAFAGVMIHYADVRISDTLFRNNNRGLHYNTANLLVEHSTFTGNRIGIRFMRFEGDVRIRHNEISGNDTGVLFVRQHVNAVDFDRLNRGDKVPRFERNNIADNRAYNFSLGEGQDRDLNVSGNWWGGMTREAVGELMYDRSKDEGLSRIIYEPFLTEPVPAAGVRGPLPATVGEVPTEGPRT